MPLTTTGSINVEYYFMTCTLTWMNIHVSENRVFNSFLKKIRVLCHPHITNQQLSVSTTPPWMLWKEQQSNNSRVYGQEKVLEICSLVTLSKTEFCHISHISWLSHILLKTRRDSTQFLHSLSWKIERSLE